MLQVARLAPRQLGAAADELADFLHGELHEDGGARGRAGTSDLYYTPFLLESLLALRSELPRERVADYLSGFGDGAGLDLVHTACLVRAWAALGRAFPPGLAARSCAAFAACRARDGGYGVHPGSEHGTLYNAFLALGMHQDLGLELAEPLRLAHGIARLRCADGGYADNFALDSGTTPTTAAAATLLRHLDQHIEDDVGAWLLERAHERGGFLALAEAPLPDLLSTATALHALGGMQVPFDALRERCLDFIDTLWTGRGFVGTWDDDQADCEYTFYALLALGHLSV